MNIAFRTNNTTYNQLRDRIPLNKINFSGIYKLNAHVIIHMLAKLEVQ